MLSIDCPVQQDGFYHGWTSIVGATFGYEAVAQDDGDASYILVGRQVLPLGRVSFPFAIQAEGLLPLSVTIAVTAKTVSGSPVVQIGLSRSSTAVFGADMPTDVAYSELGQTFPTNPFTGAAWQVGDLAGVEACVQMKAAVVASFRVTSIVTTLDYAPATLYQQVASPAQMVA